MIDKMNIIFRVDSGLNIGTGHLLRCITLAKLLTQSSVHNCVFISRPHLGNVSELVLENNFILLMLPDPSDSVQHEDCKTWLGASQIDDAEQTHSLFAKHKIIIIDLLIIDHYSIDYEWEGTFLDKSLKIFVIDDLADRYHECDFLLDQNIAPNYRTRYKNLVPDRCEMFLGISYCLLKEDFFELRKSAKVRYSINKLLIFFGGVDKENCTETLLLSLSDRIKNFERVDVVVGKANPNKNAVERLCLKYKNCCFHEQVSSMATLIALSDFSIGACGATTGERIFLGLPSIVFSLAANQLEVAKHLHEAKYVYYLGDHSCIQKGKVENAIENYLGTEEKRRKISSRLLDISESNIVSLINKLNFNLTD